MVLGAVLAVAACWAGSASAAVGPLLGYTFATGTPTHPACAAQLGSSPATTAAPGISGGDFTQTGAGCDTGWRSPGFFIDNGMNAGSEFTYFSFTVARHAQLDQLHMSGWTNVRYWTGTPGYAIQISAADQPLPTIADPGSEWTTIGTVPYVVGSYDLTLPLAADLGPGTYAVRFHPLSNPIIWTDGLGFSDVTVYGDATPPDTTPPVVAPTVDGTLGQNGWYTSDVHVSWSVSDNESAISAESGCGPQDVTADTTGVTFTCSATSAGGTTVQSVTIKRDATPPTVAFSGQASTYTVADQVAIGCGASDATSGVLSSTCAPIGGEGYTFGLGTHQFTATAVDEAGNVGSATVSFTVTVDPASLSVLVRQFSTDSGVADGLVAKLDAIAHAAGPNAAKVEQNLVRAFDNQVAAQSGKALTSAQATTLTDLASALA